MKAKGFYLFAVVLLGLAFWLPAMVLWGVRLGGNLVVWLLVAGLLIAGLAWAANKLSAWVWISAGVVLLAALCLPASTLVRLSTAGGLASLASYLDLGVLLVIAMALALPALLLNSGLSAIQLWRSRRGHVAGEALRRPRHSGRMAVLVLGLGTLLLAKAFHSLYWFLVWDRAGDPLGTLWLVVPAPAVLYAGLVLFIVRPGRQKLAGLAYLVLIPALFAIPALAGRIDLRQRTEARADRVSRAIEAYHAREGRYPQALRDLLPRDALSLPGPLILYGQRWCYDGGADYYRLGYVDREHWADPHLTGKVYASEGRLPDLDPICAPEIAAQRAGSPAD